MAKRTIAVCGETNGVIRFLPLVKGRLKSFFIGNEATGVEYAVELGLGAGTSLVAYPTAQLLDAGAVFGGALIYTHHFSSVPLKVEMDVPILPDTVIYLSTGGAARWVVTIELPS